MNQAIWICILVNVTFNEGMREKRLKHLKQAQQ